MKKQVILTVLLICCLAIMLKADIYLFTAEGHISYSTDRGVNWAWMNDKAPYSNVCDIAQDSDGNIFLLSQTGELMRSTDGCQSWTTVSTVSMVKCNALWIVSNADIFVMTEQGDVARSTNGGTSFNWVGSTGASDMVDLIASDGLFGFTNSGDVFRSTDNGANWSQVGAISQVGIVGATPTATGLFAITEEGDLTSSFDDGATWNFISTLSQIGVMGLTNAHDTLFATTMEGDIARSDDGTSWSWVGTASQVYIEGIGSDEMSELAIEEIAVTLEAVPEGIRLRFTLYSSQHTVITWRVERQEGDGERGFLASVSGERNTYLDVEVEENVKYSYWFTAHFNDGDEKEVGPFVITYPVFSPNNVSIYRIFPHPVQNEFYLVVGSPQQESAEINLYNATGRLIERLWSGELHKGYNRLSFDVCEHNFKIGIYFICLKTESVSLFHKITVVR